MDSAIEGFICPNCMVCLATSSLLQDHWIRFHSSYQRTKKREEISSLVNDRPGYIQFPGTGIDRRVLQADVLNKQVHNRSYCTGGGYQRQTGQMFHIFKKVKVPRPTFCDFCGNIIWEESDQCKACCFLCHTDCSPLIVTLCTNWEQEHQKAELRARNYFADVKRVEPPPTPKSFVAQIRHQVSRGRARHVEDAFDLDLTYVTDRIIAMSFPASGLESTYRNSLSEVASMLHQKHGNRYMVFNVSERRYDISKLNNQVLDFGWPDHLAPPLERLVSIIKSMDSWLCADEQNVTVVHCKGGKGRTGVVIAAYTQFNKVCPSPQAALDWFALRRFYDTKFGGVTQPSQKRYVHYFGDLLEKKLRVRNRKLLLCHLIIHGIPNFDGKGGCKLFIRVYQGYQQVYVSDVYAATPDLERICIDVGEFPLSGDVMVKCSQKTNLPALQDTIFRCQFHIDAIKDYSLILSKKDLDEAYKDRRFPETCTVELIFKPIPDQEFEEENIVAAFTSLSSDSGIDSPLRNITNSMSNGHSTFQILPNTMYSNRGAESDSMSKGIQGESLAVPRHLPGPINGNPYALVDRKLFGGKGCPKQLQTQGYKMSTTAPGRQSFDVSKGIKDLDNLLCELGHLSATCKREKFVDKDENSNFTRNPNVANVLPTIHVVSSENLNAKTNGTDEAAGPYRVTQNQIETEIRVKPRLPPRTSSVGAVDRHGCGTLRRTFSDATTEESRVLHPPVIRNQSMGSDDVFNSDGPVSPAISEMLDELAKSPLSPENARRFWHSRRPTNFSTKYDNVSESSFSETDEESGEFRQGRVKDHVRQFNRILSSPDPSKVGTGVPMPGLVQGINYEDKISKYNSRSLAPGQCGPAPDRLYIAGSPPKKIVYDHQSQVGSPDAPQVFIPAYADRPAAYYLERARTEHEQRHLMQGSKFSNGHVPRDTASSLSPETPLHVNVHSSSPEFPEEASTVEDLSDARPRSDSAYGGSVKGSSVASTPVAINSPTVLPSPRNDNGKSSGRGSHASSVASMDDQDSSGYARIEDIDSLREAAKASYSVPEAKRHESEVVQEQAVIAVSHTVPEESFPERLNKRVPEIRSNKDLSLAVYQTNYLPGLTNGQPTILSNSQIHREDRLPDRLQKTEERTRHVPETLKIGTDLNLNLVSHPSKSSSGTFSPDGVFDLQSPRSPEALKITSVSSDGSLGPGIHLVDSPPSPAYSARSDSSSITPSPVRRTVRHRMRRSNSSSSSLSSSELFPDVVRYPHVRFDKDNLKFWYKPKISRDEAIALLKDKQPGAFVVRDSQSYDGAFGLAVKVETPPIGILQQAGGDLSKVNLENELIRHFLIEPCKQGVRLKGNNSEPAFPSLVALIFQHSVTKMALPIELVLPTEDLENNDTIDGLTEQQVLKKGAACELVYLASIDVEGLSGDGAIKYALNKVLSNECNVKSTVITIKVNQDGITLTDNERKLFFRKHFLIKDTLCCMLDPRGRRFNLKTIMPELGHEAPCFGIVVRKPQNPMEHECIVFAEVDPVQPATAVIDFVHRAMKNGKK